MKFDIDMQGQTDSNGVVIYVGKEMANR